MEKKFAYLLSVWTILSSEPNSIILDKEEKKLFERRWSNYVWRAALNWFWSQTSEWEIKEEPKKEDYFRPDN